MATSKPVTWLVSDIIQWYESGELVINDAFQRHSVWTPQAKTLLIDTILNELPLPKIYIRTKIDSKRKKTIKEIVDGQQRIRSIVEFASNEFILNKKSEEYAGFYYAALPQDAQERFLGYAITAEQLLNATDDDVIDIFARLNSYTVSLNATEKRHAAFQSELKFFVRRMSVKFRWFIEKYSVFTVKQRFRMADDEFFAELVRLTTDGISDGGSQKLNKYYAKMTDNVFDDAIQTAIEKKLDYLFSFLDKDLGGFLRGPLGKHYQLYSLAAAWMHINKAMPSIPNTNPNMTLRSKGEISENLAHLAQDLENDTSTSEFNRASKSSTQRIGNRRIRTLTFLNALAQ